MENSKSMAGTVGPVLTVVVLSELKWWNPTLYDTQVVPLVYLSGVLLFIACLTIVRRHNIWVWGWPTILTAIGWLGMAIGLEISGFSETVQASFLLPKSQA